MTRLQALRKERELSMDWMYAIHSGTRAEQRAAQKARKAFMRRLPAHLEKIVSRAAYRRGQRRKAHFLAVINGAQS